MMGERQLRQEALFCGFSLEKHVPSDHLLRAIDRFVELSDIRRQLEPFYSAIGRPSVDPELMVRMLLIGYCCGIRSERRSCEEVHLNLAYRRFCRLGLDGAVPDHSTFSKNRHGRFRDSDLLRPLFEAAMRRCMAEGIVGGQGFAVDASMVRADASRQKGVASPEELDPQDASRAVTEYLAVWTTRPSARRPTCRRSSSRPPTPPRAGRPRPAARPATPTATTTWSTWTTPSSWTSRRPRPCGRRRSERRGRC
jgi:transposase